jgi:Kdo2-lipid IVA lauroyltransferase/acyltransferase
MSSPRELLPPEGGERPVRFRHRLEYGAFQLLLGGVRFLPEGWAMALASSLGWVAGSLLRVRRRDVEANLLRAFPAESPRWRSRVAAACYRHLARETLMTLRLAGVSGSVLGERTDFAGVEELHEALRGGKGIVMVTGHLGNWEIAGGALAAHGIPVDAVAQVQRNPLFNRHIATARAHLGMRIIPRGGAFARGFRALREGRLLGLVADQNVRSGGVFVDFFGHPAATARGPALLALRSGAPLFFLSCLRLPGNGKYQIELTRLPAIDTGDAEADVAALTQRHTTLLEEAVRRAPEQYFWLHRRWKTQPAAPPSARQEPFPREDV